MTPDRASNGAGSRFLFEPFEYGPAQIHEAQLREAQSHAAKAREAEERILAMKFDALDARMSRLEVLMERLERRLWLTVYGVVATILAQVFRSFITLPPLGGP